MKNLFLCLMLIASALAQAATTEGGSQQVTIRPAGTSAGATGELRLKELAANGANHVGLKAPDAISANKVWTLPAADGTSGQVLTTDGSGVLSFTTATGSVTTVSASAPLASSGGATPNISISSIIGSTFGGTGNGFTKFSGPTTSEKTFTLPNANGVILAPSSIGTNAQIPISDGTSVTMRSVGTDATITNAGALTLSTASISGKTSESTVSDSDELLINDVSESGGTLNKMTRANMLGSALAALTNGASIQGVRYHMQDATPSSPATDDLWYETDTNIMWFYDGTRWLSTQIFEWKNSYLSITGTTDVYLPIEIDPAIQHDIFLVGISGSVYQFGALAGTATNYWKVGVSFLTANLSGGEIANFTTQNDTIENFNVNKTAINSAYDLSATGHVVVLIRASIQAGSPGALLGGVSVTYRRIHL